MVAGIDSLLLQPVIIFDSFERVGKDCVCLINRLQYAFLFFFAQGVIAILV